MVKATTEKKAQATKVASTKTANSKKSSSSQQKRRYEQAPAAAQLEEIIAKNLGSPALKRLARRAGCTRINNGCFRELRKFARRFLEKELRKANALRELGRRQTLTLSDVVLASRFGRTKIL